MSAYDHDVEREYSARLSSGDESDMGSEFQMQSVIYMSSFAATIFVGALVTVGVLLMTLLVVLIVMLQSCQSRSSAAIEMLQSRDQFDLHDYDYCKMASLHAQLNNFESYSLPESCKDVAVKYIKDGHYAKDLSNLVSLVEDYFKNVTPVVGGRDVVLIDIDDLLPSDSFYTDPLFHRFHHYGYDDGVKEAKHLKHVFLLEVYTKLGSGGWPLVLLSREPEKRRGTILDKLIAARFEGWSELMMRSEEEMKMKMDFSKQKAMMQAKGYNIRGVISSRMDVLVGPFTRAQIFKIPNLFMMVTPKAES